MMAAAVWDAIHHSSILDIAVDLLYVTDNLIITVAVCRIRWIIVRKYRLIWTQNEGDEEYFEVEQKQTMKDIRKIWMTVGYMLLLQVNALIFDCLIARIEVNLATIIW